MCDPVPFPAKYTKATIPQKLQLDIKDTDIASSFSKSLTHLQKKLNMTGRRKYIADDAVHLDYLPIIFHRFAMCI